MAMHLTVICHPRVQPKIPRPEISPKLYINHLTTWAVTFEEHKTLNPSTLRSNDTQLFFVLNKTRRWPSTVKRRRRHQQWLYRQRIPLTMWWSIRLSPSSLFRRALATVVDVTAAQFLRTHLRLWRRWVVVYPVYISPPYLAFHTCQPPALDGSWPRCSSLLSPHPCP